MKQSSASSKIFRVTQVRSRAFVLEWTGFYREDDDQRAWHDVLGERGGPALSQ